MAVYDGSIRIHTNINPDKISDYKINTESFERLNETLARMKKYWQMPLTFKRFNHLLKGLQCCAREFF